MGENDLAGLEGMEALGGSLVKLVADGNGVEEVGEWVGKMQKLQVLNVADNRVLKVSGELGKLTFAAGRTVIWHTVRARGIVTMTGIALVGEHRVHVCVCD